MDFITSDTHFLHANSLNFEGCALRKSLYKTEEEMNEGIIRQWNKQAKPDDTIFVLGDIACATDRKNAGFTDEEREKLTDLLKAGFIDTFRYFKPDVTGIYYWCYRFT